MRKQVRHIIMTHDDKLHYSVAANVVLFIALVFLFSNALFTGGMIWYLLSIVCLYYLVAVGVPVLYRLTRTRAVNKTNHAKKHKKTS